MRCWHGQDLQRRAQGRRVGGAEMRGWYPGGGRQHSRGALALQEPAARAPPAHDECITPSSVLKTWALTARNVRCATGQHCEQPCGGGGELQVSRSGQRLTPSPNK